MSGAIVLLSGGLDSSVLLADACSSIGPADIHAIGVDYGQRHCGELVCARHQAERQGIGQLSIVSLYGIVKLLGGCALTDPTIDVPDGRGPDQAATVVPNRNAILLSVAFAAAISSGAEAVYAGFQAGDRAVFPDCRPAFVVAFQAMQNVATEGFGRPILRVPFLRRTKADVVRRGAELGVDLARTRSCYADGLEHCGRCGPCRARRAAFAEARVDDPTIYEEIA